MHNIISQATCLISEILILIDQGEKVSIQKFEEEMDNGTIIEFIKENYGFKNINSIDSNQNLIKERLKEQFVSESKAKEKYITNNGLVYLVDCLVGIIENEAFDYKWNYEELIDK